jgi:hypothetical protein
VANFHRNLIQGGSQHRECGDVGGVAVTLDHLGRYGRGTQPELGADCLFVLWPEMPEGADGAGELAYPHILRAGVEADQIAHDLGIPVEQLEAEGRRLGMDAMGAADGGRVLELQGTQPKDGGEGQNTLANES